jgi:hypothetical protein
LELDKKIKINIEIAYRFVLQNKATKCPWGATLAERKSRFYLALPIINKTAQMANNTIAIVCFDCLQ